MLLAALGDSGIGAKTSALMRFVDGTFNYPEATIGAAFLTKKVTVGNVRYTLEMWDTAGQEKYCAVLPLYTHGADAIYLGYDITNCDSFTCLKDRLARCQAKPGVAIVLVGNKCDLEDDRKVSFEEGLELAAELSAPGSASWADIMSGACGPESWDLADGTVPFFEISAKEDINIYKSFMTAAIFGAARREGADRSLLKRELHDVLDNPRLVDLCPSGTLHPTPSPPPRAFHG